MTREEIKEQIEALKPWHMSIPIADGLVSAKVATLQKDLDGKTDISVISTQHLLWYLQDIYGKDNLTDKSLLDIGCNAGGYCFLANELGYKFVEGFDPRTHWIKQANFIKKVKNIHDSKMRFSTESTDSFQFVKDKYDVCILKGVLYHVADPITCLRKACEATKDLILINTAYDPSQKDGYSFRLKMENTQMLMSGVEGLSWHPTGPEVVQEICSFYGFKYSKVIRKTKNAGKTDKRNVRNSKIGRFSVVVSRHKHLIDNTNFSYVKEAVRWLKG